MTTRSTTPRKTKPRTIAAVKSDSPQVQATLAALDVETPAEPFVYGTKAGKRVVFPDPGLMPWEEAEEFLLDIAGRGKANGNREILVKWVGEDGMKAIDAEKLNRYQFVELLGQVQQHYASFFGADSGEDDASES